MNKKQALAKSLLALLLCVAMLVSTTFAWFTDSVVSGLNTIAAGNLDVELYHSNAVVTDQKVTSTTQLFLDLNGNPILWEPGVVSYENLRITNEGDLALIYQLAINTANENYLLDNGAQYGLSQVLKVGVVENGITATDRDGVVASVSSWSTLGAFLREGDLLAGGEKTWGVVIYWQPGDNDNNWNANNGKQLSSGDALTIDLGVKLTATQMVYENDSFGNDYDAGAKDVVFPSFGGGTATVPVDVTNGVTTADATIAIGDITALVPAGTKVTEGTTALTLSVKTLTSTTANVVLGEDEALRALDVHVEGVAADNTTPITVTLPEVAPVALNMGNYKVYHVEGTSTNEMTLVSASADFSAHNQYKYDPATGDVVLYMATFSEVAVVAEPPAWEGGVNHSWYDANATDLSIYNADQLWSFSQIVGGMAENIARDSFKGKTVTLRADINLGDKEAENNPGIIFYPIGYNCSDGKYEKTGVAVDSSLKTFEGTFDGNGHTIMNFYHNTWEMKGDHNWYTPEEQYYRDGMGLFGRVYKATIKNLTVKDFTSDGEIATTGVIAAYAEGSTFENIAIFNCNPRVYNIGNGGIVGCVGWYAKEAGLQTTFTNVTVDNSNKISALWGSYDVACGGIVGQYYPESGQSSANYPVNGGISFENCHVSAIMDVYNDVCGNYQYYAYRYAGMLIGSVRENETIDGHVYPKMDGITAKDCTVHYGTWNDYYYCEFEKNGHPSYSGPDDYKFSRVPHSELNFTDTDGNGIINNEEERASVTGCKHNHTAAEADNTAVYLPFNNLVTGYGWGVTSKGVEDVDGVTVLDREVGDSVVKFESQVTELSADKEYKLGDLFSFVDNGVKLVPGALMVSVTNLDENGKVSSEISYVRNSENWQDWANGTISFKGTGSVKITIQDYYFCTPTSITVTINSRQAEKKFDVVMNNGEFLHRVGNVSTVPLSKLFKAKDGVTVGTISVTIATVDGTGASGTWTPNTTWNNGTIQFAGTGVVKVTITDNDYCIPTELYLEVVDATNVTGLSGAISGNVVLLNDCGLSSLTVSGRNAVYGNGFTATYTGNGQYLNNGLKQGVINVSENGMLDNLRIVATIYPTAYLYYGATSLGDYVQGGPSSVEGDKTRYHYQLSAVAASGNATIQNCYIYGGRANVFINTGDVTIKDTVLECGVAANVHIQSNDSHTITLEDVTTIQHQVNATIGNTSTVMLGTGVLVGPETTSNPTIVLNGTFKQYNWVTSDDAGAVSNSTTQTIIQNALNATDYNHQINRKTASNLGIIYMNEYEATVKNNTGLPYVTSSVKVSTANGQVCSLQNASANQIYSDYTNADKGTVNGLYQPQFKYDADLGGQYVESTGGDEHCYREGDTIHVMFPSGDTKELDLAGLVNIAKYSGQDLHLAVTCKNSSGDNVAVTNNKISLSSADTYTVTYTVTDTLFYDKDGNTYSNSIEYSWNVTVAVSLKDVSVPNAYFVFDSSKQKMGYYKPSFGDVKQYIPFLAGLTIYDYNGQEAYLRFDGSKDYNKVASITITGYESNKALVEIKLTDGGVINTRFLARANSGGASTYTGKIKTSNNTIYFVNDGGTSNKDTTTTAAYWYVDYYKFTGNNGEEIISSQQTFNSTGSSASTPSGNFSTSIKYTVTYNANEGNCGQTMGYATSAAAAVTLPTPSRSGYIFAGWYTAASGGTRVGGAGNSYTPSANITLYAQWGKPCTVTYNANGGNCGTASEKYTGTSLTLPTPTRDGYWFIGWYDAATGGNKIGDAGATYNPADEITLYAHWQEKVEYTVTYNANGGSCGTASATYQGSALTLPTPTRTGYTFTGWYTAASGGNKIGDAGASYTPSANITLYAQWTVASYTITVTTSNATVKVNDTTVNNNGTVSVQYGTTVSVTVSFDKNNSKTFTVKNDTTGTTILSKSADGTYSFTMPDSSVTINASSSGCFAEGTLITLADGTQKPVEQVTYDDMLLAWDFNTGSYAVTVPSLIEIHEIEECRVITLQFADGTNVRIVAEHGFFDTQSNRFVFIDEKNVAGYIGHDFVKVSANGSYETVALIGYEVTVETISYYTIQTAIYNNCIAENMFTLTSPPEMLDNDEWFNYFEIGEGMKYDEAKMQADIEKYGLYEYSDFAEYVTYEQFMAFNGPYLKVLVGKGYITLDEIIELIGIYVNP